MVKIIQIAGIIGFFICLFIMYKTELGPNGIKAYDPAFQLPDMKFHYSAEKIGQTFGQIGEKGREIYQKYLILDFVFTACFLVIMISISNFLHTGEIIRNLLLITCIARAVFDVLENSLLIYAISTYPIVNKALLTICANFTSLKFVMLFIWIIGAFVHLILKNKIIS